MTAVTLIFPHQLFRELPAERQVVLKYPKDKTPPRRFRDFGPYEDAIVAGESVLHHAYAERGSAYPRLGMLVRTFDKMPEAKRANLIRKAETFLQHLDKKAKSPTI